MNELKVKAKGEVSGRYKFIIHKADAEGNPVPGTDRVAAEWFPNLITDYGMHLLAQVTTWQNSCQVGAGNSAPLVTNTVLDARIAGVAQISNSTGRNGASPYFSWRRSTYRFAAGQATGNISEVGIGVATTGNLFSRALILDGGGSPTTITVLADEVLDVLYELRYYPNETDVTGSIVLDGISYDYILRASNVTSGDNSLGWSFNNLMQDAGSYLYFQCYYGAIGSITGTPANYIGDAGSPSPVPVAYNNDFIGTSVYKVQLNNGNHASLLKCLGFKLGWGRYQLQFNPAVPKNVTNVLTLTLSHSWVRRP